MSLMSGFLYTDLSIKNLGRTQTTWEVSSPMSRDIWAAAMATPETLQTSIKFARAKVSSNTVFRKVDRSDRMCPLRVSCNCGVFLSFVLVSLVKLATLSQDSFMMGGEGCRLPISRAEGSAGSTEAMMKCYAGCFFSARP